MPTLRPMTKPSLPSNDASHQPLVHLPISTVVPLGMRVTTSLSVPGPFRKFVSAVVAIGLAVAQAVNSRVTIAADAAARTKLMAGCPLFRDASMRKHANGGGICLVKIL